MTDLELYRLIRRFDLAHSNRPPDNSVFENYDRDRMLDALRAYIYTHLLRFLKAVNNFSWFIIAVFLGIIVRLSIPWKPTVIEQNMIFPFDLMVAAILFIYLPANSPARGANVLFYDLCTSDDILFLAWLTYQSAGPRNMLSQSIKKTLLEKFKEYLAAYKSDEAVARGWSPADTLLLCRWIHIDPTHWFDDIQLDILAVLAKHGNSIILYDYLTKFRKRLLWFTMSSPVKDAVQRCIAVATERR